MRSRALALVRSWMPLMLLSCGMLITYSRAHTHTSAHTRTHAQALAAKQFQEAESKEVIPTKYVSSTLDLQVCCLLYYLDYSGTADGTSIKNILPQVSPRKLVLVSGTEASHADLRDFCLASDTMTKDVFLPRAGETLNVSSVTNIYQVCGSGCGWGGSCISVGAAPFPSSYAHPLLLLLRLP